MCPEISKLVPGDNLADSVHSDILNAPSGMHHQQLAFMTMSVTNISNHHIVGMRRDLFKFVLSGPSIVYLSVSVQLGCHVRMYVHLCEYHDVPALCAVR